MVINQNYADSSGHVCHGGNNASDGVNLTYVWPWAWKCCVHVSMYLVCFSLDVLCLCGTMDWFVAISCCLMWLRTRRFSFGLYESYICLFLNLVVSISCHLILKACLFT
jgi:hypothetical protein